jgi:hypothetical protein
MYVLCGFIRSMDEADLHPDSDVASCELHEFRGAERG